MNTICPPGCIPSKSSKSSKSSKCPKDKILNPKTGRCVSINGTIGKSLVQTKKVKLNNSNNQSKKVNSNSGKQTKKVGNVKDPLDIKYRNVCDTGLVCEINPSKNLIELSNKIGEFSDVYAVANNNKPLAALDFSAYGRKKLKKLNVPLINNVIEYCNFKGVQMIHNTKIGGGYLKSICFLPSNYKNALKLMALLWYPNLIYKSMTSIQFEIGIGLLLGYNIDNIIYFIYTKHKTVITKKDVLFMKKIINKATILLEDLQSTYKIVHYNAIKYIK